VFAKVSCAKFEVRNEVQKQDIFAILSCFCPFLTVLSLFDISAINAFEKITVTGDRNNNSGGKPASRRRPTGV